VALSLVSARVRPVLPEPSLAAPPNPPAPRRATRPGNAIACPPPLGRRILFAPHRRELVLIAAIILFTSALSVISALLVRQVFDKGLFVRGGPDLKVLIALVAVLMAIPIVNGVLNIVRHI
jgi:hypothetical protein